MLATRQRSEKEYGEVFCLSLQDIRHRNLDIEDRGGEGVTQGYVMKGTLVNEEQNRGRRRGQMMDDLRMSYEEMKRLVQDRKAWKEHAL